MKRLMILCLSVTLMMVVVFSNLLPVQAKDISEFERLEQVDDLPNFKVHRVPEAEISVGEYSFVERFVAQTAILYTYTKLPFGR